ncbi:MAG: magnesium/cobalt transporter CorA [Candidatus Zixiibacteriota bacterium]
MIVTHTYQPDRGIVRTEGLLAFDELLRVPNQVFWVDFSNPTDAESYVLTADFGFHPLAIEDVIAELPGPKVDDYGQYLFVVFKIADYPNVADGLATREVDIFLLRSGVVTIHYDPIRPLEAVARRCQNDDRLMSRGADFLFHAVLDHLVDHYDSTLERMEDEVDLAEDEVFAAPGRDVTKHIFSLKRDLAHLKRIATPQREILNRFARDQFPLIGAQARLYFRDAFDHMQRVNDLADSLRDTLNSVLEVHFSAVQKNTNDTIKILTIIATVFLPMYFLTGVYGMNFVHFPEIKWRHGYLFFWGLCAVLVTGMLWLFRRRKWL